MANWSIASRHCRAKSWSSIEQIAGRWWKGCSIRRHLTASWSPRELVSVAGVICRQLLEASAVPTSTSKFTNYSDVIERVRCILIVGPPPINLGCSKKRCGWFEFKAPCRGAKQGILSMGPVQAAAEFSTVPFTICNNIVAGPLYHHLCFPCFEPEGAMQ